MHKFGMQSRASIRGHVEMAWFALRGAMLYSYDPYSTDPRPPAVARSRHTYLRAAQPATSHCACPKSKSLLDLRNGSVCTYHPSRACRLNGGRDCGALGQSGRYFAVRRRQRQVLPAPLIAHCPFVYARYATTSPFAAACSAFALSTLW